MNTKTKLLIYSAQIGLLSLVAFGQSTVFAAPPIAVNDVAYGGLLETIQIDVLANDIDDTGSGLTIVSVTSSISGTTSTDWNQVEFTPNSQFCGTGTFIYTVEDWIAQQDTWLVTTYSECGLVAVDDNFTTPMDTALIIPLTGIRSNDSIAYYGQEGVRWFVEYDPAFDEHETSFGLLLGYYEHDQESFLYTPYSGFCWQDFFEYEIRYYDSFNETVPFIDYGYVIIDVECPADPLWAASSIDDDWMEDALEEEHLASDDLDEEDETIVDPATDSTDETTDASSEQFENNPLVKKVRIAEMIQKRNESSVYHDIGELPTLLPQTGIEKDPSWLYGIFITLAIYVMLFLAFRWR